MLKKILDRIGVLDSTATAFEFFGKILGLFVISGSGFVTANAAEKAPWFADFLTNFGPFAYITMLFLGSLAGLVLLLLWRVASRIQAEEEERRFFNSRPSSINPKDTLFEGVIIAVEDLRLPGAQKQARKTFKNCDFVGPGVIFAQTCTFDSCDFKQTGSIIPVDHPAVIVGCTLLEDCIIENCTFHRVQFLMNREAAEGMLEHYPNAHIAGSSADQS